jgi:long-chain acyl-CoA synthetase
LFIDDGQVTNVPTLIDEAGARFAERTAVTIAGRPLTYRELPDVARGGARVLRASGGRHVVYLALSGPVFPLAVVCAAYAGLPFTSVNYRLAPDQIAELIGRLQDPVVIADAEFAPMVKAVAVQTMETDAFAERAYEAAGPAPVAAVAPGAPAVVLYTSGTTAVPKAVMLRQGTLYAYLSRMMELLSVDASAVSIVSVPPYHITGVMAVIGGLCVGRRMVFLPTFTPEGWLELVRAEGVTSGTLVPTMVARIVRHLDGRPADVPTLRAMAYGGSRMPRSVLEKALRAFPTTDFLNGYGLTETSSGITILRPEEHREALASDDPAIAARLGSAGTPVPGAEIQIRSAGGDVLGPGEVGELWVRGPQVSGEYIGLGSVLDADGWFPTKDLAYVDEYGYLYINGRADDTIIRGGENIAPAEIEDVLDQHPAVHTVAVVGVPDEEWGERIVAAVVARPGTTAEELKAYVRERLRGSRTPDEVVFRTDLPYTDTGKVLRRRLVQELVAGVE